jgi:hypothetical protein
LLLNDENRPIINKTKAPNKGKENDTRWKDNHVLTPSLAQDL